MADLSDVYGATYQDDAKTAKNNYTINTIANNMAHRQFGFKLPDALDLWDSAYNLPPRTIAAIIQKVRGINKQIVLFHIDKKSRDINMLPELIIETPVEYFWIIDGEYHRAYFVYITPYEVNAY